MSMDQVMTNAIVRATRQAANKVGQLAGIEVKDIWARVDAVCNLVSVDQRLIQALPRLRCRTILPAPWRSDIGDTERIVDQVGDVGRVGSVESTQ